MIALTWVMGCVVEVQPTEAVQDVHVVATQLIPPQPVAGEPLTARAYVANPAALDIEVLIWSCVPTDDGCAEPGLGLTPAQRAVAVPLDGVSAEVSVVLPPAPDDVPTRDLILLLWTLACVEGACAVFDDLRATPDDPALHEILDDPQAWDGMPGFDDAALGYRVVELRAGEARIPNRNPRLLPPVLSDLGVVDVDTADPDGDRVELRGVVTSGTFLADDHGGVWSGTRPGTLFVVGTDHEDGLDVVVAHR